ncbi:hypothetical protein JNE25003_23070 [Escherichia coli]
MSKFVKAAVATAMLMGALTSASVVAAGNNGTVRFYGTIEDSPCSIVPDDHKLEVDMGSIGTGSLTGGKTTTPKDFQIRLQDCNFNTETTMATTFTVIRTPLTQITILCLTWIMELKFQTLAWLSVTSTVQVMHWEQRLSNLS